MQIRPIHILFIVSAVFMALALTAHAYVLQGAHILDLYVQQLGNSGDCYISQKLTLYDASNADSAVELYQNIKFKYPDTYRSEILAKDREWIQVRSQGKSVTIKDGRVFNSDETLFDRYTDLLFGGSRKALEHTLYELGVDVSISSLGRFNGMVVYVVGAKYPDESRPQIWFDKNSFRPVRWLQPGSHVAANSETTEILFSDWRRESSRWYPMHIRFTANALGIRDIVVNEIKADAHFPEEQFDVDRIRSIYPAPTADKIPDDAGMGGLTDFKKTSDDFKRIYK